MSLMYLYVKWNWDIVYFWSRAKDCMISASSEYRNMLASRGAQLGPIGMPTVCRKKIFPAKTTKSVELKLLHIDYVFFGVLAIRIRVLRHKILVLCNFKPNI